MKKLLVISAALLCSFINSTSSIVACEKIVGRWLSLKDSNLIYDFNEDGTFSMEKSAAHSKNGLKHNMSYSIKEDEKFVLVLNLLNNDGIPIDSVESIVEFYSGD